jgi:hypothetical protein
MQNMKNLSLDSRCSDIRTEYLLNRSQKLDWTVRSCYLLSKQWAAYQVDSVSLHPKKLNNAVNKMQSAALADERSCGISFALTLKWQDQIYCHDLEVFCVTYKTGSGFDDWIYWHLVHKIRDYRQCNAIADLHTLQFTVTHALRFSVFTSRILATVFITVSLSLQITHGVFFSQPKFLSCHYSAVANSEDSTQFNFSCPKLISRQAGVSKLDSSLYVAQLNFSL